MAGTSEQITAMPGIVIVEYDDGRPDKVMLRKRGLTHRKLELIVPDSDAPHIPNQGTVYAVGSDVDDVRPGDFVYYNEPSPEGFKWDGKHLIPVRHENVLAVRDD